MTAAPDTQRARHPVLKTLGGVALAVLLLILFWSWDWFVPLVNSKATALLHRKTTIAHLHVQLGRVTTIKVDALRIEQPKPFEKEKDQFAQAKSLTVSVDVWSYLWHRRLRLPLIALEQPTADIIALKNTVNNYTFTEDGKPEKKPEKQENSASANLPEIGELRITDGALHVRYDPLQADMQIAVQTTPPKGNDRGTLHLDAKGGYAQQPITARFIGGALLSFVTDKAPYPVDLTVQNGPTNATLKGDVLHPMRFAGAHLKLHFAGPDMSLLYPLTGVPIPRTPAYSITGNLDYSRNHILFKDFEGKMGSSDIGGTLELDPHQKPMNVEANLRSRQVNLVDLGGFIGAKPTETASEKKQAANSTTVLPDTPINIPRLNAINAHVTYRGAHIENKKLPLDKIDTEFFITNGEINLKRLNFAVGNGTLASTATLKPDGSLFDTSARIDFARIDLARVMQATANSKARGIIGGHMTLKAKGNSIASLMAAGNGGLTLVLDQGGDITAILPDIMGLQLGNAILTALGLPSHTDIKCFIADMPLKNGIVSTNTLLLETGEARTLGRGTINFKTNTLDYALTTRSQNPTIASLPGAFHISGLIKSPTVLPGAEILGRAAAAAGLGFVFPPLALLPTIQFGVGDHSLCTRAVQAVNSNPAAGIAPGALSHAVGTKRSVAPATTRNSVKSSQKTKPGKSTGKPAAAHTQEGRMTPAEVRAAWAAKLKK
ncbi:AsmA family protein [Acetobacter orleanensis]|uniref:Membrane protein n=1 Tax=Acetobacter orleanensis TaxID=104099 RepID=A0A4Y3TMM0_9PROT|nr:AsmA family protein [Acetobacter orleanensis]KXV65554.1 lipopolysaccharide biosynthesis protein [Acetobacter orleanensis]PCD79095.1 AsmA family protein [Acetobacter orleanensis]GAN67686.1 lipopolysaccharide biogenesis periplasmic protein [Acetobacter orleanensis JCM 7639]GBR22300.1 lipopolysaccharide biogenesis periplasmic protein AsmA [Acetobacter orleanensis NRIC 0473]GEB83024.1 membrane protein [Acetobacter orleanensis]